MKKILFVNGNFNDIPLIESAHKLGMYVITSGNDPKGEGHAFSDMYVPCDYSNKEAMLNIAKQLQIDAVCSCGNDFGATTAAYIAEKLNLPGHDSYKVSKIFHEKDEFKKIAEKYGLLSPKSRSFLSENDAIKYLSKVEFPQIVKPVDLGGGKGISVANTIEQGINSIRTAFAKSKVKHIVIEDYIQGTQHGFICYIKNSKVVFDYSTNDYSYLNPYMVWIASGYPADGYQKVKKQIIHDVELLAAELNMSDGFLTIQYMMKGGKAYYLETMRRCLGNLHFKCIAEDININLYDLFVATEAGLDTERYLSSYELTGKYSGFMGIYADRNGIFESVSFDSEFEKYIFDKMILYREGDVIENYLEDKLGMIWYSFTDELQKNLFISRRNQLCKVHYKDN